jgi:Domain of unknown function (DUF4270)
MNNKLSRFVAFSFTLCLLAWQCTKPTPFGSEFFDGEVANFDGDSLDVICTIERPDSVQSVDRTSSFDYFLCGQLNDPEFGITTSEIYSLVRVSDTSNITTFQFDSVSLLLPYAAAGFYGDTLQEQTIQIFQLSEAMDFNKTYYVYDTLPIAREIGRLENVKPRPRTIRKALNSDADTVKLAYVTVPLDPAFGQDLMAIAQSTKIVPSELNKVFKGIKIKATTPGSGTGAIMAFDLNASICAIRLHYTKDTLHKFVDYRLNWTTSDQQMSKFMHIEHNYQGTPAETALAQTNPEQLFIQGMGGLRMKVEFPADPKLTNIIINKAELQCYGPNPSLLTPVSQLATFYEDSNNDVFFTSDVSYSIQLNSNFALFGGTPRKVSNDLVKYQFTMTDYFQSVVKNLSSGDPLKRTIYVDINSQLLTPSRSIIYGPTHPTYPLKMRLKFTKL